MRLFSLSTAEQGASMAIFDGPNLVCESYWASPKTHSKCLMSMVEQMVVGQAGLVLSDIDGFIAARGPGRFTGLRIGISVVKGLAYGVSKPCAGISSLDGIALRFSNASMPVCVMMDAKRKQVYSALYQFCGGRLCQKSDEVVCAPEHAVDRAGTSALFVGSGSKAYQEMILARTSGKACFSHPSMDHVSATALVRAALEADQVFHSPDHLLVPVYLRKSDAEINFS
ncbi:MAG: tRNA (adenosine(37)-N6)-threonylcarbamoyltransferase complex dimerization subunit type 1 TsaB [Desulfobacter sp.]|nr:tRNA (adenosine(37)-N6)-threonylcarbamoyltransferase complex dimerization subunit type 1 TsaB [Desulfobacter sp.]WDP85938.1 MAG: tRNA (adenosine(37)-N6)-threonylcarbamoyltransferase complex dimerization subunit type 1 TsaB [Desulfobacter sp.]